MTNKHQVKNMAAMWLTVTILLGTVAVHGQLQQVQLQEEQQPEDSSQDVTEQGSSDDDEQGSERPAPDPIDDQLVQLELWDGSTISGKLEVESLDIETSYGRLTVPIGQIKKVLPGLQSYPELKSRIDTLVESLGDKDFDVRESSQRELSGMGVMVLNLLEGYQNQGSAEQKKRLKEILVELQAIADDLLDSGEFDSERTLSQKDTIVTREFTIVGAIQTTDFLLQTKFGDLTVKLNDIKAGDRTVFGGQEIVRKQVKVGAEAFFQRKPVNTRIRVNRGDRIKISASGVVNWTNWSQNSTPDGLPNQGNYQGITSGKLIARVGTSGKFVEIGTKGEFRASSDGVLYLGIAIQDNYVQQGSYRWTGEYQARVVVEPQ